MSRKSLVGVSPALVTVVPHNVLLLPRTRGIGARGGGRQQRRRTHFRNRLVPVLSAGFSQEVARVWHGTIVDRVCWSSCSTRWKRLRGELSLCRALSFKGNVWARRCGVVASGWGAGRELVPGVASAGLCVSIERCVAWLPFKTRRCCLAALKGLRGKLSLCRALALKGDVWARRCGVVTAGW